MARTRFEDVDLECELVIAVDDEAVHHHQDGQVEDLVSEPEHPSKASPVSAILFILLIVVVCSRPNLLCLCGIMPL